MIYFYLLISLVIVSSMVQGFALPPRSAGNQTNSLPFPVEDFTKTVASVQNAYCGATKNVPGIQFGDQTLLYAYGDGNLAQRTNIYHSDSLGIIVAYEGTNVSSLISILHDVDAVMVLPNADLGLPLGTLVFNGWQVAFHATWLQVKQGLSDAVAEYPDDPIIVTGHSLGAAIATLASLAIDQAFPNKIKEVIVYGPPRVGNPTFADAYDGVFLGKYTGVSNGQDWVQNVPTQEMGYRHPTGIVWINPANSTSWTYFNQQEPVDGPDSVPLEPFYPGPPVGPAPGAPGPSPGAENYYWVNTWVSMQQVAEYTNLPGPGYYNQSNLVFPDSTIRQTIHTSIGGQQIRLTISNQNGVVNLPITAVTVALPLQDPNAVQTTLNGTVLGAPYPAGTGSRIIDTNTIRQVTFSGNSSIIIPDGSLAVSDPIDFPVAAQSELSISIYLKDGQNSSIITSHPGSRTSSYYGMGNQVNNYNITGDNVVSQQHWFFISALEVWSPPQTSAFYVIGDSITDGRGSWNNGNNKWTDNLLARMQKNPATSNIAVGNQGAGGNRVLTDGNGPNAMGRVERDVIAQPGAKYAMIFEGVNDIGTAGLDEASQEMVYQRLIQAYKQMVTRMHTFGIPVFGATITPIGAANATAGTYTQPQRVATVNRVNDFIRNSKTFDAVFDFNAWLADPNMPTQLNPLYDSGDFLHPNELGYQVIADKFDLGVFGRFKGGVCGYV
ncbi:extracellular GDSL-like lipase/acylhydrolase, partial [Aureobasidium melanogenum]